MSESSRDGSAGDTTIYSTAEFASQLDKEPLPSAHVGRLVGFAPSGVPLVQTSPSSAPSEARTTVPIEPRHIERDVVLVFEHGEPDRPIIVGLMHDEGLAPSESPGLAVTESEGRVVVSGDEEIVIRTGKASITLTKDGKVLIRGEYVLSRSTGVNRVLGGSIQLN